MLSTIHPRLLTVCLVVLGTVRSSELNQVCKPTLEFWSTETLSCTPCTRCAPEFTISPCAVHKDAICGPLSALELDWSFLPSKRKSISKDQRIDIPNKMFWWFPETNSRPENLRNRGPIEEFESSRNSNFNEDESQFENSQQLQILPKGSDERQTDDANNLPWDWQTSALVLAVCACIIFFMVAGCSALIYVRQWRQMKRNFEPAGLEEISARLNLMVKAELAELSAGAPMSPGDPETRCQYLEKLLDRKRETPLVTGWPEAGGNLYIEAGGTPKSKRAQIARIHRNIESILSHKNLRE